MLNRLLPAFAIAVTAFVVWFYWKNPLTAKLKIRDEVFLVEMAVTPSERERGLSGRSNLEANQGMLFVFGEPGKYHFWMRDMRFPLDFIWINGDTVVDLATNIPQPQPNEAPTEVAPQVPVDKVLEVKSGTVEKLDIEVGDKIEFPN